MVESSSDPDPCVSRLAALFRSHPAWTRAAALLSPKACSNVRFQHQPGVVWHLARVDGVTRLEAGARADADLELAFPAAAIERLEATRGGIGAFAVALFDLASEVDESLRIEVRILAPFSRLVRRGYLRLLVAGGPEVIAWGAAHGVQTLGELRRWVARVRKGTGVSSGIRIPQEAAARRPPGRGARKGRP